MKEINPHVYRNKSLRMLPEVYGKPITMENALDVIDFVVYSSKKSRFGANISHMKILIPDTLHNLLSNEKTFKFLIDSINHECLHFIIYLLESKKASKALDYNCLGYKINKWLSK